jgi:tripartite-type tricarboxylate transporter receptor subunit TctC
MKFRRRQFLRLAACAAGLSAASRIATAQTYPTRPVRFVHGFAAGGSGDIAARLIAQWLSDRLGQQFVVENRTGAGGNIAVEAVVRAPADGYTLLQLNVANTINTALYKRLSFNLLNDITPVASFMRVPNVMEVTPSLPVKTVPEFIAYARENPGKISACNVDIYTFARDRILAIVSTFTTIEYVSKYAFWVAIIAYVVLAIGNLVKT